VVMMNEVAYQPRKPKYVAVSNGIVETCKPILTGTQLITAAIT